MQVDCRRCERMPVRDFGLILTIFDVCLHSPREKVLRQGAEGVRIMVYHQPLSPPFNQWSLRETIREIGGVLRIWVWSETIASSQDLEMVNSKSLLVTHPGKFGVGTAIGEYYRADVFCIGLFKEI